MTLRRRAGPIVVVVPRAHGSARYRPGRQRVRYSKGEASRQMANPNARDTKLIQYLNEAYGKEKELETALEAHIAMTTRPPYKKRLREHLKETKGHSRQLKTRIRELGGKAEAGPVSSGPTSRRRRGFDGHVRGQQGRGRGAGSAARDSRHRRGREDAQEREDRVPQRVRGDRDLHGHRGARGGRERQGDGQARPRHSSRGGAHGEVPREADPAAGEGGGQGGDPGRRAS